MHQPGFSSGQLAAPYAPVALIWDDVVFCCVSFLTAWSVAFDVFRQGGENLTVDQPEGASSERSGLARIGARLSQFYTSFPVETCSGRREVGNPTFSQQVTRFVDSRGTAIIFFLNFLDPLTRTSVAAIPTSCNSNFRLHKGRYGALILVVR